MDVNKDRKLSKGEFKGPLKEMFTSIDNNEDGYFSFVEVEIGLKSPRNGH